DEEELGNKMIANPQDLGTFEEAEDITAGEIGARFSPGGAFDAIIDKENFQMVFNAMASQNNSEILAKPRITALNNQEASIRVGDERQIQVSRTTADGVVTSLQSVSAYTELRVTPTITSDRFVQMDLMISSDDFSQAGGDIQTETTRRTTENSVLVKDGQTVVIGGLIQEQEDKGQSGIPYLMDIPVLGHLFKSSSDNITKRELVVFLTPRVITSPAEAKRASQDVSDELQQISPFPVNLNIASRSEIARVQGLSPEKDSDQERDNLARQIVRYRSQNGPLNSYRELLEIPGITAEVVDNIVYKTELGIDVNTVSLDDLTNIKQIDIDTARSIIRQRDEMNTFQSLSPVKEILISAGMDENYFRNRLKPILYVTEGGKPGVSTGREKEEESDDSQKEGLEDFPGLVPENTDE
ncbi:MAG: helix-hairpin-helix domain-containing protein, partial [bacterium]